MVKKKISYLNTYTCTYIGIMYLPNIDNKRFIVIMWYIDYYIEYM